MTRNFTIILLLLFIHQDILSQIRLHVFNAANGSPLEEVWVQHQQSGVVRLSDEKGNVGFSDLKNDTASFILTAAGFDTRLIGFTMPMEDHVIKVSMDETMVTIEEIIVEASHLHKKEIINKLDINLRPLQNAQEILRMVPGLFIGQHAGGGKAEQIFLRGFDIDHGTDIQLTVDDMPVNMVSHAHGQGYADLHFVIPELVEKVDFSKGPYMAEKGNFTTAGWVNLKTKNTLEQNTIKAELGQFDTYRLFGGMNLLTSGAMDKHRSAYVASEYNFSNSFFEAPQNFNRFNIAGKYIGDFGKRSTLHVGISHFSSQWNHSGQIPNRAVESGLIGFFGSIDPTEGGNTSRSNLNLQTMTSLKNGGLLKNQVYLANYDIELYSNFTFFLEDSINGDQIRQKEKRKIMGYSGSVQTSHQIGAIDGELHAGILLRHDLSQDNELSQTVNRLETQNQIQYGNIRETNLALFIAEQLNLSRKWNVEFGLRFEKFYNRYTDHLKNHALSDVSSFNIYPKFSACYQVSRTMQWYWKTGKGFHSNDTRVVIQKGGKQIAPAAYGADLGMLWKPANRLVIQPALWYLWLDQEFVYVGDAGVVEAGGRSQRMGVDLSVRYQLTKHLFADADFNYAKPRALDAGDGNFIPLAPIFTSVGGLSYQRPNGFSGSIRYRYMGDRPANETNSLTAVGYTVCDLQLSYPIGNLTIAAQINNLFNSKWKETQFNTMSRLKNEANLVEEIHFTPGSPFFFKLSLSYGFNKK
ncbi:MAG: TonB-dependent receptor [Saprospiraceae bacterium]|nr:TonB-dependent receptor [Saprospiraceae bacterium]